MLFNSFQFVFVFLPVAVLGFALLQYAGHRYLIRWLTIASFVFYTYWKPANLPILVASILFNFAVSKAILQSGPDRSRRILVLGIAGNLVALAFFKYAAFLVGTVNGLAGTSFPLPQIELPLGISFFTFTQIAFLVDAHQRKLAAERGLEPYALFVSYFPHLIAGPILHHKQMMGQFAQPDVVRLRPEAWAVGLTFFGIGLAKKVLLADPLGAYAAPLFDAANTASPGFGDAWAAALTYTFQLYFDFSGYSDMAVGLSLLFGITIPINFNSPYKARNIIEFWRRWHISLSTFLRDYLYVPLGGNRHGSLRRYVNLMITMVLGGLWHGAAWTFVAWGALHGVYLLINHAWRSGVERFGAQHMFVPGGSLVAGGLTFLAVVVAWVFFRAESFDSALRILSGMASVHDVPDIASSFAESGTALMLDGGGKWILVAAGALIAFLCPNSNEICAALEKHLAGATDTEVGSPFFLAAVAYGLLLGAAIVSMGRATQFLYFQF